MSFFVLHVCMYKHVSLFEALPRIGSVASDISGFCLLIYHFMMHTCVFLIGECQWSGCGDSFILACKEC